MTWIFYSHDENKNDSGSDNAAAKLTTIEKATATSFNDEKKGWKIRKATTTTIILLLSLLLPLTT